MLSNEAWPHSPGPGFSELVLDEKRDCGLAQCTQTPMSLCLEPPLPSWGKHRNEWFEFFWVCLFKIIYCASASHSIVFGAMTLSFERKSDSQSLIIDPNCLTISRHYRDLELFSVENYHLNRLRSGQRAVA